MPPKSRNAEMLLAYCRERLEQISQEIDLLKDIVEFLGASSGGADRGVRAAKQGDAGEEA